MTDFDTTTRQRADSLLKPGWKNDGFPKKIHLTESERNCHSGLYVKLKDDQVPSSGCVFMRIGYLVEERENHASTRESLSIALRALEHAANVHGDNYSTPGKLAIAALTAIRERGDFIPAEGCKHLRKFKRGTACMDCGAEIEEKK